MMNIDGIVWSNMQEFANQTANLKDHLLRYAVIFLVIALIAGFLGFSSVMGAAAGIAQILFFVFLAITIVSFLLGLTSRKSL